MTAQQYSSDNPGTWLRRARGVVLAVSALAALALAACGDDGPGSGNPDETPEGVSQSSSGLSMQEYYGRLEAAFEELRAAAERTAPNDLTSTDQLLPFLQDSLSEFSAAMTAFADEVDGLSAPPSVADAHSAFASAVRADAESTAELAEEVRRSSSLAEVREVLESRNTTLLQSREPCRALQEIAAQAGIPAALPCDE